MRLRYAILDVFTDTPYTGNPLAVVFGADDLPDDAMQRIAREFNLSETVFVRRPRDPANAARLRIFMPTAEVPFAGHPTIGAAYALASEGVVGSGTTDFVVEERIGDVPIRIERREPFLAWLTTPPMHVARTLDAHACATALGVDPAASLGPPPEVASAGNEFCYVALRTTADVDRAWAEASAFAPGAVFAGTEGAFVFTPIPDGVYARMFAPLSGVPEDPATGSATGPLGLYLTRHDLAPLVDGHAFTNVQGVAMGRPSRVRAVLRVRDGTLATVEIGGGVVPVMTGDLVVPSARKASTDSANLPPGGVLLVGTPISP